MLEQFLISIECAQQKLSDFEKRESLGGGGIEWEKSSINLSPVSSSHMCV